MTQGIEWLLWMDDDAIFTDMNFTFPYDSCEARPHQCPTHTVHLPSVPR